jgi:hypothetical protein
MIDEFHRVFARRDLTRIKETIPGARIKVAFAIAVAGQTGPITIRHRHDLAVGRAIEGCDMGSPHEAKSDHADVYLVSCHTQILRVTDCSPYAHRVE